MKPHATRLPAGDVVVDGRAINIGDCVDEVAFETNSSELNA